MSRDRRAYVILVLISFILSAGSFFLSVRQSQEAERNFCDVIVGITSAPAPKPTDPAANPSRERAYIWHEKFVRLGQKIGC